MKKLVFFIVIGAGLLFAGKLLLEYQYRQKLDDGIQLAQLYAGIRYEKLYIDFDGSINLKNITVRRNNDNAKMKVGHVRLFSSNRLFLLKGFEVFANGNLPDSFQVNVRAFEYDDIFVPQLGGTPNCSYFPTGIMAGQTSPFTNGNRGDFNMVLNGVNDQDVRISYDFDMLGAYSMNSSATFDSTAFSDLNSPAALQTVAAKGEVPINRINFSMKLDSQFANEFLSYCSEKLGLSVEDYQATIMDTDQYYRRLDLVPSVQLKQAMQRFFVGESELNFQSNPSQLGKNFRQLSVYQPKEIARFLNLKLSVDGEEVPELFSNQGLSDVIEPSSDIEASSNNAVKNNAKSKRVAAARASSGKRESELQRIKNAKKDKYRKVRLDDAKRYIGYNVRVERRGRLLEGRLLSWGKDKVILERRRFGGKTEMPLNVYEIIGLEIVQ